MFKIIFSLLVVQSFVSLAYASQPIDLKSYLELECNIVDSLATGFVSLDIMESKECPAKTDLFCQGGLVQAENLLTKEVKNTVIYSDYIKGSSVVNNIVEILGDHYIVVRNSELFPLVNAFWLDNKKEIIMERTNNNVIYKVLDAKKTISLTVGYNQADESCDFTKPKIQVLNSEL